MTRFLQRAAHSWLAWGLIVFAALFSFSSPSETSVGFRSRNLRSKLLFHSLILELASINQFVCFLFCGRPLAALAAFGVASILFLINGAFVLCAAGIFQR
jgi:hypothetical protein